MSNHMEEQLITCPYCNEKFPLSEAMRHEIEEQVNTNHQRKFIELQELHKQQLEATKKEAESKASAKARDESSIEIEDLKNQVTELSTKSEEFKKKELNFLKREREIAEKEEQN